MRHKGNRSDIRIFRCHFSPCLRMSLSLSDISAAVVTWGYEILEGKNPKNTHNATAHKI